MAIGVPIQPQVNNNALGPIQQVQAAAAAYIADPTGDRRAQNILQGQQAIITHQGNAIAAVNANLRNLVTSEVIPLEGRVKQQEKNQTTNYCFVFTMGAAVGAAAMYIIKRLTSEIRKPA